MMTDFNRFKFSLLTYCSFGILVLILLRKIDDLQNQLRSVQQELRFAIACNLINFFDKKTAAWVLLHLLKTISKRDFLLSEISIPDLRHFDEPKEFQNVKNVPAIFTINTFDFTEETLEECSCDKPIINGKEKFLIT